VRNVEANGPADRGGVETGDIILRFQGRPIERSSDLPRLVGGTKPGTQAAVEVWRKGSTRELQLTVGELEPEQSAAASREAGEGAQGAGNPLGLVVAELSDERKQQLRVRSGVVIQSASGAAARAGLRSGDVLLALNNQDVSSVRQFNELSARLDRSRTHVLLIRRGDSAQYVPIRPAPAAK
jgi:serine protease Do